MATELLLLHSHHRGHSPDITVEALADHSLASKLKVNLRSLIYDKAVLADWDLFVDTKLQSIIEHQITGSYQHTAASPSLLSSLQVLLLTILSDHILFPHNFPPSCLGHYKQP
jgi:hypothetical protein